MQYKHTLDAKINLPTFKGDPLPNNPPSYVLQLFGSKFKHKILLFPH